MSVNNKRSRPVFIRLTSEEYDKMERLARQAGMSMSSYIAAVGTGARIYAAPIMALKSDCGKCGLNSQWPDPDEFDVLTCINGIRLSMCNLGDAFSRIVDEYRVNDKVIELVGDRLEKIWLEFISLNEFFGVEVKDEDDEGLCEECGEPR